MVLVFGTLCRNRPEDGCAESSARPNSERNAVTMIVTIMTALSFLTPVAYVVEIVSLLTV